MDLKNEQENMERILRPTNDNYSWIIGYILAVVEILLPWVMLLVSSISNTEFPVSEFLEFLSYSTIIGLIIFVCLVRRDRAIFLNRKYRKAFQQSATKTSGTIVEVKKEYLNSEKMQVTSKITGRNTRVFWKVRVVYFNEYTNRMEEVYSEYYKVNPVEFTKQQEIDVFYKYSYAIVGDFRYQKHKWKSYINNIYKR